MHKVLKNIRKYEFPILLWKPCAAYRTISIVSWGKKTTTFKFLFEFELNFNLFVMIMKYIYITTSVDGIITLYQIIIILNTGCPKTWLIIKPIDRWGRNIVFRRAATKCQATLFNSRKNARFSKPLSEQIFKNILVFP